MKQRAYRGRPPAVAGIGSFLLALAAGLALGVLSKWSDQHVPFLADLTSNIAVWIFLATAVALLNRSPARAAVSVLLFLGGMVGAYYVTAELLGGVWSKDFLIGWGAAALVSPVPGWLVWHAREENGPAWLLSIGVVAAQVGLTLFLYRKLNVTDAVVVVLTVVMLFWKKVKNMRTNRRRRRRR